MRPREVVRRSRDAGWQETMGSEHVISVVSPGGLRLSISNHPGRDVPTGVLRKLERQSGVRLR